MTLSLLKVKKVIATDLEEILEITKMNVKENYKEAMSNLIIEKLEW